jgi:hypothetical protein
MLPGRAFSMQLEAVPASGTLALHSFFLTIWRMMYLFEREALSLAIIATSLDQTTNVHWMWLILWLANKPNTHLHLDPLWWMPRNSFSLSFVVKLYYFLFLCPQPEDLYHRRYVKYLEFMGVESLVFFHLFLFLSLTFFLSVSALYTDLDWALKLLAMRPPERKVLISMYPYTQRNQPVIGK